MLASQWPTAEVIQKMISFHERTLANIQHSQWGQQTDIRQCMTPSHTPLVLSQPALEDSAQLPLGDTVTCLTTIHSIPRGNVENERNPTEEREVPIPSWDGLAAYRERWYQNPLQLEKTTAQWTLWKCQGHWTFVVPWAHVKLWYHRT